MNHSQLDNFRILKTLGSGYSGKVKLGQDMTSGNSFALKIILPDHDSVDTILQSLKKEFDILKNIDHPSVVKMFDLKKGVYTSHKTKQKKDVIYAMVELVSGGEIFDFIFHTKGLDEDISKYYFRSLVQTLADLHKDQLTHRDLKPENLMLDHNLKLKLIDFGFATVVNPQKLNKTNQGTEKYMSPELLYHKSYDAKKVDVFAAGVILFVMHSGYPPFNTATQHCQFYYKFVKDNDKFWKFHSNQGRKRHYSPEFIQLINSMIDIDFTKRPSFSDILEHPWLNSKIDEQSVLERMATFKSEMEVERALNVTNDSGTDNRNEAIESFYDKLNDIEVGELQFEKLVGEKHDVGRKLVFKTTDQNLLARVLVRVALDLDGVRDERKDKLLLSFGKDSDLVKIAVKFLKLSDDEVEVQLVRKEGYYFDFQKLKYAIAEKLNEKCYSV